MKKNIILILFFSILFSLFFAEGIQAVNQEAYIVLVEYSLDDPSFGPYNSLSETGVIAWVEDINGPASGGKIYRVAAGAPSRFYPLSLSGVFDYQGDRIAEIDSTKHADLKIYSRYTVKNTGSYPIEALRATHGVDITWGREGSPSLWSIEGGPLLQPLGYLNPGETKNEIFVTGIKNFPQGYIWKPIILGWPDGNTMPNENLGLKAVFYFKGPDFSPPEIDCYRGSSDQKMEYGGTYTHTCTYTNSSLSMVYLSLNSFIQSRLEGTWGARWIPPAEIPQSAIFYHSFGDVIVALNPNQILNRDTTFTINDIFSPGRRNVNLNVLQFGYCHLLCLDSNCNNLSSLRLCHWPRIGYGVGKYLGVKDPGTISTAIIGASGRPAYRTYFDLWNPHTTQNETVQNKDYYVDIQILKKGDFWYKDGSTAVSGRHYKLFVGDLKQEPGATPVFPGIFWANDGQSYPFFFEIPDIDLIPAGQTYELYTTTVWVNHPRTGVDEPLDQIVRSFAPGTFLSLENVKLPSDQFSLSTNNNYIWNFSSFPVDAQITLSENIPNFSITTPLPITLSLGPGEKRFFPIGFQYSGSKPSSDTTGSLAGNAFILIAGNPVISDSDNATIFIEKSSGVPTATDLSVNEDVCSLTGGARYRFSWRFLEPGDSQSAYRVQVFRVGSNQKVIDTGKISSVSQVFVNNPPTFSLLGWGTSYYWQLKVWDSQMPALDSAWITGASFTTPVHSYPYPEFTFSPPKPSAKESIDLIDSSKCYSSPGNIEYDCRNNISNRYQWDFKGDGTIDCDSNTDPACRGSVSTIFPHEGPYKVALKITDNVGTCEIINEIIVNLPMPSWQEISPF